MLKLDAAGFEIVLHVHDEVVAEVDADKVDLELFKRCMLDVPDWAAGLPLATKVRVGDRYIKTEGSRSGPTGATDPAAIGLINLPGSTGPVGPGIGELNSTEPTDMTGAHLVDGPANDDVLPLPDGFGTAVAFLEKLRPGGPWVLVAIVPLSGAITATTAYTTDQVVAFIRTHNGQKNLYYQVNPTRTPLFKKAAKTDLAAIEYILSDCDPAADETSEAAKRRYLEQLNGAFKPKATAGVDSGNGIQGLWKLKERITLGEPINGKFSPEDQAKIDDVEARAAAVMKRLGAKAGTQNIDRILRLPGTINLPNAKKQKEGRVACETKLLWFDDTSYPLDAFPKEEPKPKDPPTQPKSDSIDWAKVRQPGWLRSAADLPDDIPHKVRDIVNHAGTLKELNDGLMEWGQLSRPYGSWSDVTFALAASFKAYGIYTPEQIAEALLADLPCNQHITGQKNRHRAVERAITRSYDPAPDPSPKPDQPSRKQLFQSSAEFVADFVPPDYLIDGLLQRRYVYSFTAKTGDGKTTIALLLAACVARGTTLAGRAVEKGRVLFFAGENPDDVRSRWIKLCEELREDPDQMDVVFMPFTLDLSEQAIRAQIDTEAAKAGPFSLLIVDTSASYYSGDDENDNVKLGKHARMLRTFVELPDGPTILVTCHPIKNPDMANLLPRGGGAFLAEMDGNLVCVKDASTMLVEVTWHGKFRGPDFAPFSFKLIPTQSPKLVDSKGRLIWTVYAQAVSSAEQETLKSVGHAEENKVLQVMLDHPGSTLVEIATHLNWLTREGEPSKQKVHRVMAKLQKAKIKLVEQRHDDRYVLTKRGQEMVKQLASETANADAN
jgi:hypothetical protein